MGKLFTSLFSGGGGADLGAIAAGFEHCQALEYNPQIADVFRANIGDCFTQNILDADPYKFERPDLLHASPVCKQFSTANSKKGERDLDIDCAKKVAKFITVLKPKYFSLENVEAYRKSKSFHIITEALFLNGYFANWETLNAADFGVPQSRRRLILLAVHNGFIPSLPLPEKHIGWYEAIKDKVHDLPDSKLADWQLKALQKQPIKKHGSLLLNDQKNGFQLYGGKHRSGEVECVIRYTDDPSPTLTANTGKINAILDEPCWTLRAMGQDGHYHRANALLENARVVALDIPCLARLQSFPDNYQWSGKKSLDGKIIGNSVPPLMYQKIISSVF